MMAKTPFVLAVLLLAVIGQLMNKLTRLDADLLEDFSRGPKSSVLLSLDAGDVCTNGTSSSMMGKNHRGNAAYANAIRTPLTLGVEIRGIRLAEHLADDGLFERIKADCYRHRLLVFRGQGQLPADALLKMFEGFGDIYHHPYTTQTKDMNNHRRAPAPAITRISNDETEGFKGLGTSGWHMDGIYKPLPFSHLIFNAIKAPTIGATKFAGHREMLASLPRESLEFMDHIWTVNRRTVLGEDVSVIHPLIYNHPVVNDSVLCIHLGYMGGAIYNDENNAMEHMLTGRELQALKAEITRAFERDNERFVYAHKWEDGDLVVIDNQQIAHLASKESQLPRERVGLRILHRLSVTGFERPTKKEPVVIV